MNIGSFMWKNWFKDNDALVDYDTEDYGALERYVNQLAKNKLGYPVSLLTYLGVVNNNMLGIQQGTIANVLLNNVGDPFKDSETSLLEVKRHERAVLSILEKYYGVEKGGTRGYVTTGGTEGNFASLWWSKRYVINKSLDNLVGADSVVKLKQKEEQELMTELNKIPVNQYERRATCLESLLKLKEEIATYKEKVQQIVTPTVFYTKGHTHYSVPKISEILHLSTRPIEANDDGSMDINDFRRLLIFHVSAHPDCPIIVIANIGTTITGATDNVPEIKRIIEESNPRPVFTIHMDGALTGFVLPILKPFGDIKNYFSELGVNTLAVSAHKYPGLSQPCGVLLATKEFFEKAFEKGDRNVEYVGNIVDSTITGSRSGLNVLMLYHALHVLGLDKNNDILSKMVAENLVNAKYLYDKLVEMYDNTSVQYPYHFNVIFPRPSQELARKYQLMLTGDKATICVLTNANRKLIDRFISDLKEDKEKHMNKTITETNYKIVTLAKEHVASATELFTKVFCDHEPITKHIGITHKEYEPFVTEVLTKAVRDGLSVVAVDNKNKVIACTISEDIADLFKANTKAYPKLTPVIALLEKLSSVFCEGKKFKKGKIAHVWIAAVAAEHRGTGMSTAIDMACGNLAVSKGYDFAYAEFTNPISENITHHYKSIEKCGSINYENFTFEGQKPFKGVKGGAVSYIVGIRPGVTVDSLPHCYTM